MAVYKDEKAGSWCVNTRYTDWEGNPKRKHKRGFKTKREATDWERGFLLQRADDLSMTFSDFYESYEKDRRPRLKENTWLTKEYMIREKILPYFGNKPMNEITPRDIVRWQNSLIQSVDKHGKPYSQTYLKAIHNQLTAILSHAVRFYDLKSNPATKAGSMGKKDADEMKFWTLEQYEAFALEAMTDLNVYYAFEVLYWCGIRLGELLALTFADVDLKRKTITINKSYQRIRGQDIITDPKTPKSKRTIVIPDRLCDELKEYRALVFGWDPQDRMFPFVRSYLGKRMNVFAERAGLEHIRVHDLRHSHVSLLVNLGFSVVAIAARLGHDSVEITHRYAHLFPTVQSEMADQLNTEMKGIHHVDRTKRTGANQVPDDSFPDDRPRAA